MNRQRAWALQHRFAPYLFVLPFVVLFCVFMLYPLCRSITLSFQSSVGPRMTRYVGLRHYRFLVRDWLFWVSVGNTLLYGVLLLAVQLPASLGLALLLNSRRVRGRNFFRFAFFSTHMVGQVFVAVLFYVLLAPRSGLINRFLAAVFPFFDVETNWRGNPLYAMPAIVLASLWLSVGYGMVYFLAALQGVDPELYEAADLDGAGGWSRFRHVTLPGIRPIVLFLLLIGTIGALQLFELPYVFFGGGGSPFARMTIVMYLYEQGFESGDLGFASAVGWALVFLILVVAALQLRAARATGEV